MVRERRLKVCQQIVGRYELADVVEQPGQHDGLDFAIGQSQTLSQTACQVGDPAPMAGERGLLAPPVRSSARLKKTWTLARKDFFQFAMGPALTNPVGLLQFGGALGDLLFEAGVEIPSSSFWAWIRAARRRFPAFQTLAFEGVADDADDFVVVPGLGDIAGRFPLR